MPIEENTIYSSNNLICRADSNEPYSVDEIRAIERDVLLSSIDERIIKSCEIDVVEIERRLLSKKLVLVDIRPAKEFENYRISKSINIPPFEVKSKDFLKAKHVVIVGKSANIIDMGLLCHELKQQGFEKVNFIKGGVGAWKEKAIGKEKNSFEYWKFGRISTRKFASLRSKIVWLVLDVSNDSKVSNYLNISMGDIEVVPLDIKNPVNLNIVKNHIESFGKSSMYGVITVSKSGKQYAEVDEFLRSNNIKNTYYLDGGAEAYAKYITERKVFLSRFKRGPVKSNACHSV